MFEGLRKKLADTIKGFVKHEEVKVEAEEPAAEKQEVKSKVETEKAPFPEVRTVEIKKDLKEFHTIEKHEESHEVEELKVKPAERAPEKSEEVHKAEDRKAKEAPTTEKHEEIHKIEEHRMKTAAPAQEKHEERHITDELKAKREVQVNKKHEEMHRAVIEKEVEEVVEKHDAGPKIDLKLTTKIKKIFVRKITLSSAEIDGFAESLKEPMLRSDVSYSTTEEFIRDLKGQLTGMELSSGKIDEEVTAAVRSAFMQILEGSSPKLGLDAMITRRIEEGMAPVKILFLGPNGAGKTTTIAKLAYTLKAQGVSSVIAASDTFRAAAIEQLEIHAKKIGVSIVKSKYGADPASVAFDAIAHAKSNGVQLVLIDSAGRQETNKSLIKEMEKIVRVCKPDITIFIGESTAGNVISEQISEFGKYIHIDGIILTKLDCDAKGGSALSIAKMTGIPILFFGIGEGYDALIPYSSEFVVNAILPQGG